MNLVACSQFCLNAVSVVQFKANNFQLLNRCAESPSWSARKKNLFEQKKIAQISRPLFSNEKPDFVFDFSGKQITGWKNWDRQTFIEKPKKKKPKPSGDFFVVWRKKYPAQKYIFGFKIQSIFSAKIQSAFLAGKLKVYFWRQNSKLALKKECKVGKVDHPLHYRKPNYKLGIWMDSGVKIQSSDYCT